LTEAEKDPNRPTNGQLFTDMTKDLARSHSTFEGFHEMCRMASANPFVMTMASFNITNELKAGFPELYKLCEEVQKIIEKGPGLFGYPRLRDQLSDFSGQRYDILTMIAEKHGVKIEKKSSLILPG